jgi:hypothetical protein
MIRILTLCLVALSTQSLGVNNPNEQTAAMTNVNVDIDWSGLMNNIQEPQPEYGVLVQQPAPMPLPVAEPLPVQAIPMPMPAPVPQVAVSDFMNVSSVTEIQMGGLNTVADLIVRSWANTWSMIAQDPQSSIDLIYAAYKPLDGSGGVHWRLVFCLKGFNNTEYIALDVAALQDGTLDIFRNITTRNLTDINLLFGVTIGQSMALSTQWLKESFLWNAPMSLNTNYDAAQANTNGFDINWTLVQNNQEVKNIGVENLMMTLGGQVEPEPEVVDSAVFIGSGITGNLGY